MLRIDDISYSIQGRPLFEGASATIPEGHKVGLVGPNGAGKTTLFRLIRGELSLDGGEISLPSRARIGGVAQEAAGTATSVLDTVLAEDKERAALLAESHTATDAHRIAEIQTRLADIDAWSAEARAASILDGLGFSTADQARPTADFSGGWRMRVALAGVLFAQPDVLLLDEPTNYLDLEGALWLETYLARYPHTVIIISHDRDLLNRAVGHILHLESRKLTLDLLKPGTSCKDIWETFNAFMRKNGRPEESRLYCHGQGYDLVERPLIRSDEPWTIEKDMNIVVHPTYGHGGYLNWLCDNYIIGGNGPGDRLHQYPEKIDEVG